MEIGDIVTWKAPLDADEADERFEVVKNNGTILFAMVPGTETKRGFLKDEMMVIDEN